MTGSALLTVIATILTVESGMVEIDLGRNGGLQAGDEGMIFYEIGVGGEVRVVELGKGTVTEASSYTAKLQMRPGLEVRSGFLIRFDVPKSRLDGSGGSQGSSGSRDPASEPTERPQPLPDGGIEAFVAYTDGACLNLRPLPSLVMPSIDCLPEGTRLTLIDSVPDWKKARLTDGREGWLATQYLSAGEPARATVQQQQAVALVTEPAPWQAEPTRRSQEVAYQLQEADSEVSDLLGQVSRSQDALSEAERKRAELSRRLLETTVSDLETQLDNARLELEETRKARSDLLARIADIDADRGRLAGQLAAAEASQHEVAAERERLRVQLAETQSNYSRVSAEHDRVARELETSRSDLAQLEAIASAAKDALRSEVRHSETSVAELRGRLDSTQEQLALKNMRLETLEAEHQALAAQLVDVETGPRWSFGRNARKTRKALRESERARVEAENSLALLQTQREAGESEGLQARLTALTDERDRLVATVAGLERQLSTSGDRARADIEAELSDARYHIAELEIRLAQKQRPAPPTATGKPMASAKIEDLSTEMEDTTGELVVLESAAPCLNFRAEPSLGGRVFDCLEPGTRVGPVGRWEGWRYVELADQRAGWVSGQHIGPLGLGGGA